MKRLLGFLPLVLLYIACQDNEPIHEEFTGNETTYPLLPGSAYQVSGNITFREKLDGFTFVRVQLTGTEGNTKHPVHIHVGNLSTPDARVSALLNPVNGETGISETTLTMLADESSITYQQILKLDACVKVHLSDAGTDKDIVLAAGNIGSAAHEIHGGRSGITVCSSDF
jgi:hypothetical protein